MVSLCLFMWTIVGGCVGVAIGSAFGVVAGLLAENKRL
jgi:hypothetical protein